MSLDLDGNDLYFVEALLKAGRLPKLFIVDYNAKFPPPIRWQIRYDPQHKWMGDDYFGAALASFADLFAEHGYFLAACNGQTGANAFFVRNDFREAFAELPSALDEIYVPPSYFLHYRVGHQRSLRTVARLFS